jgi:hypothetical protein
MNDEKKVIGRQFMHSCRVKTKFGNAVIVKERVKYENGDIESNIAIFNNPKRCFYLTQQKYRRYKYKPEYELISRLDKYCFPDHECNARLAQALELRRGYLPNSDLFKSPYVFGADISIEALIKMRYFDTYPDVNIIPITGFLDIETSIDTGEVILISYICGNRVFTSVMRSFLYKEVDGTRVAVGKEELIQHISSKLSEYTDKYTLTYDLEIFDTEVQLIAWIFKCIHEVKADFIGIWNMNFDIPQILEAINRAKCSAANIFSDPSIPKEMRYLNYYEDSRPVAHFTLKWHWLYSTCGSQFIDSMGLYSQCRKTNGFRARYDLDSVLNDEVGMGKLKLADGQSHVIMQRHHFMDYVAYNIVDVLGLNILEKKNNDILSMVILSGPTPVSKFSAMTVRATNSMYWDLISKGMVLASSSSNDDFIKFDKLFGTSCGGTVLPPERVVDVGVKLSDD